MFVEIVQGKSHLGARDDMCGGGKCETGGTRWGQWPELVPCRGLARPTLVLAVVAEFWFVQNINLLW